MHNAPKCILAGELETSLTFSSIHCDPLGAIWAVSAAGTRVYYFSASEADDVTSNPTPDARAQKMDDRVPIYECDEDNSILSIVFPVRHAGHPGFVCVVTSNGQVALGNAKDPSSGLHQSDLGIPITAATAISYDENAPEGVGLLISSFDGTFSEVIFVQCGSWSTDGYAESTLNGEPEEDKGDADEVLSEADSVVASALFRIRGCLHAITFDVSVCHIVTVAESGDVDVWNWRTGEDETTAHGMPSYPVETHGIPTCAALLEGGRLWIGTATGAIAVFALRPASACAATRVDDSVGSAEPTLPPTVWLAHTNRCPVRALVEMSFGRTVWSHAADDRACVWDAETFALCGTFALPGTAALAVGVRLADTALWSLRGGAASRLSVREGPLSAGRRGFLRPSERIAPIDAAERLSAHDALLSHLCAIVEAGGEAPSAPPHVTAAVQWLEESNPSVRALPGALAALASAAHMTRRALTADGFPSRSLPEDVRCVLQQRREGREGAAAARRALEKLRAAHPDLAAVDGDAGVALESLGDAVCAGRSREDALRARHEADERRIASLERSLAAARRAAAVTSAEATRLVEWEAKLDAARREAAAEAAAAARAAMEPFEAKEQLARRAFAGFIETENGVLDRLEELLATPGDAPREGVEGLLEWLCDRVEAQRTFHHALRRSYVSERNAKKEEITREDDSADGADATHGDGEDEGDESDEEEELL